MALSAEPNVTRALVAASGERWTWRLVSGSLSVAAARARRVTGSDSAQPVRLLAAGRP